VNGFGDVVEEALKFGEVEVTFLEVDALVKLMEELMNR